MAFEPGQVGNPHGTKREKKFLSALERAIAQDDANRLRDAAEKVLDMAAAGEAWAVQFLADRLDGKPTQQIEMETTLHDGEVSDKPLTPEEWEAKHGVGAAAGPAARTH